MELLPLIGGRILDPIADPALRRAFYDVAINDVDSSMNADQVQIPIGPTCYIRAHG
jgi:hypothetical protein